MEQAAAKEATPRRCVELLCQQRSQLYSVDRAKASIT